MTKAKRKSIGETDDEPDDDNDGKLLEPVKLNYLAVPIIRRHPFTDYRFTKKLGQGAYSVVFKGIPTNDIEDKVALKEICVSKLSKTQMEDLRKEMNILSQLNFNHIVKLHRVFITQEKIFLVMEYLKGGELLKAICSREKYSEEDCRRLMRQLVKSLKYMHTRRVIHRDIKPENIILATRDFYSPLKLVDFGFSIILDRIDSKVTTKYSCGTPGYMAPEILAANTYGFSSDIWSLGVVFYIMLSGVMPFNPKLPDRVKAGVFTFPDKHFSNVSDEAKDMIRSMLIVDTSLRISADKLLQHPWMIYSPIVSPINSVSSNNNLTAINSDKSNKSNNSINSKIDACPNVFVPNGQNDATEVSHIKDVGTSSHHSIKQTSSNIEVGDLTSNLVYIRQFQALKKFRVAALVTMSISKLKGSLRRRSSPAGDKLTDIVNKAIDETNPDNANNFSADKIHKSASTDTDLDCLTATSLDDEDISNTTDEVVERFYDEDDD